MTDVIDRLAVAMNAHDLGAVAGFIHEDYRSEQPAHPGRAFAGRAQMLANWEAMFAGIPDFRAGICRSVQDGEMTWTEWRWSGSRSDGQSFEMRGVTPSGRRRRPGCVTYRCMAVSRGRAAPPRHRVPVPVRGAPSLRAAGWSSASSRPWPS